MTDDIRQHEHAGTEQKPSELVDKWNRWGNDDCVNMNKYFQASSLNIDFVNPEMAALYGKKLPVIKKV